MMFNIRPKNIYIAKVLKPHVKRKYHERELEKAREFLASKNIHDIKPLILTKG